MKLTVDLPPAIIEKLQALAASSGKDVDTLVREAIDAKLADSGLTLRDILAPIHREVEASGISDDELIALTDEAIAEARTPRMAVWNQ